MASALNQSNTTSLKNTIPNNTIEMKLDTRPLTSLDNTIDVPQTMSINDLLKSVKESNQEQIIQNYINGGGTFAKDFSQKSRSWVELFGTYDYKLRQ